MHGGSDDDTQDWIHKGIWCNDSSVCQRLRALLRLAVKEAGGHLVLPAKDAEELCMYDLTVQECEEGIEAITTKRYPQV